MLIIYLTPVFYPIGIVPEEVPVIVDLNPVRVVLEAVQDPILSRGSGRRRSTCRCAAVALVALGVGIVAFRRSSDRIPFYL